MGFVFRPQDRHPAPVHTIRPYGYLHVPIAGRIEYLIVIEEPEVGIYRYEVRDALGHVLCLGDGWRSVRAAHESARLFIDSITTKKGGC